MQPVNPPWIFDDGNPATWEDELLTRRIELAVGEINENLTSVEHLEPSSGQYASRFIQELHHFLLTPQGNGGLGICYDPSWPAQTDPIEFFQSGCTRCLGYEALFSGAARIGGIDPSFFEETSDGILYHAFACVRPDPDSPDELVCADPESLTVREVDLQRDVNVKEITENDFMAGYHINRALLNYLDEGEAENEYETALRYAPEYPSVLFSVGLYRLRQSHSYRADDIRAQGAAIYFRRLLEVDPQFPQRPLIEEFLRALEE